MYCTYREFIEKIQELSGWVTGDRYTFSIEEDELGQIIIYTDLMEDETGSKIIPFKEEVVTE